MLLGGAPGVDLTKLSTQISTGHFLLLASVAVAVPLRRVFDYVVDPEQAAHLLPGMRVRVPFGRRDIVGIVISAPREQLAGDFHYRPLRAILDHEPLLGAPLLELCRWVADYYHHPLGEVLAAALPT
ncbi:MAG: primosomal protein, partial [Nevskia sp.]|nr:primosomal protein [Nevskia sp.]